VGKYLTFTSVHLATMALKDELIASLRSELSVARTDRLRADAARDAAVARSFELLTPRTAQVAPAGEKTPRKEVPTLDLSEVDPTDNNAIRDLALREMPGKASAGLMVQKMESIRAQVYLARLAKSERAKEVGTIEVPESVNTQIEDAIAKGKEQARVQ
jgi:hypothetical protein